MKTGIGRNKGRQPSKPVQFSASETSFVQFSVSDTALEAA